MSRAISKSRNAIAIVALATLLSGVATREAGAGVRLGIGSPLGVAKFATTRLFSAAGLHRGRSYARHSRIRTAALRPQGIRSQDVRSNTNARGLPGNSATRGQIAAAAALAGWHGGRVANGWWQQGEGGYGWVGPLFWPFAYDDIYDYAIFGDGIGFWDYGYPDIHAGIFAPYGQHELAAYMAPAKSSRRHRRVPPLEQFCGDARPEMAALPIERVRQAVQPTETQRASLDQLAGVSIQAAQIIRASCPTRIALTAPERLAAMSERLDAMITAEQFVQLRLEKFLGLLDDGQTARLDALGRDRRRATAAGAVEGQPAQACGAAQPAALQWPADEIEAALHLNDTGRAALEVLQQASSRAAEILNATCQPKDAITPPDRLAAADRRLNAMLQAVNLVSDALEDFYDTLTDEQKAQFEAIGPKRTASFSPVSIAGR
jgi:LTXXQ motif family protein